MRGASAACGCRARSVTGAPMKTRASATAIAGPIIDEGVREHGVERAQRKDSENGPGICLPDRGVHFDYLRAILFTAPAMRIICIMQIVTVSYDAERSLERWHP